MMLRKKLRYILLVKDPDIRINAKNVRLLVNLKNSQNHTELLTSDSVVAVQWLERYVWFGSFRIIEGDGKVADDVSFLQMFNAAHIDDLIFGLNNFINESVRYVSPR